MPFDVMTIGSAVVSFAVFFFLQVVVFRIVHPDAVLKWIMNLFAAATVIHCLSLIGWSHWLVQPFHGSLLLLAAASYTLFGLMAFVYILCVFGPSETSIRIRLLRELSENESRRLSHEALLTRYNGRMILERRIQRLILAGEIREENGRFVLQNKSNAFFMIDAVAALLQKFTGKS